MTSAYALSGVPSVYVATSRILCEPDDHLLAFKEQVTPTIRESTAEMPAPDDNRRVW